MKIPSHPPLFLAAAILCAAPVLADDAERKAMISVIRYELVSQAANKAALDGKLDLAATIKTSEGKAIPPGWLTGLWPCSMLTDKKSVDPPIAVSAFPEVIKDLTPMIADSKAQKTSPRKATAFYVQFSRTLATLFEVDVRGAPYVVASKLAPNEYDSVAKTLSEAFPDEATAPADRKGDAASKALQYWKKVVPLACDGLADLLALADQRLTKTLDEYIKVLPAPAAKDGDKTQDDKVGEGLVWVRDALKQATPGHRAHLLLMKQRLEEIGKKYTVK